MFCLARVSGTEGKFTVASYRGSGARKVYSKCPLYPDVQGFVPRHLKKIFGEYQVNCVFSV